MREFWLCALLGITLFVAGTVCGGAETPRGTTAADLPVIALDAAIADYHPQDVIRRQTYGDTAWFPNRWWDTPDEYDASADHCWDRYLELKADNGQLTHRVDSLSHELNRARGRIADFEQGVTR